MRFAIATIDRYLGVFEAFVNAGWQPLKLFTVPLRSEMANQQAVINYALQHNTAIQLSQITEHDLRDLQERGCEALIVASYDWKIGDWRPHLKYAANFHPSPLPEGRGAYPVVRAILENKKSWAVTCHRLTPEIDKGDIIAAEYFPLQPDECHESIDLKTQMAAKRLAARIASSFANVWEQATSQSGGSYWKKQTLQERVIDFQKPIDEIMRHIRAFGSTESLAYVNNAWLIVKRAVGWTESHSHPLGQVVHAFNRSVVVAASNGYIALLESYYAPNHIAAEMQANVSLQSIEEKVAREISSLS